MASFSFRGAPSAPALSPRRWFRVTVNLSPGVAGGDLEKRKAGNVKTTPKMVETSGVGGEIAPFSFRGFRQLPPGRPGGDFA